MSIRQYDIELCYTALDEQSLGVYYEMFDHMLCTTATSMRLLSLPPILFCGACI
jgi:hypothetical protein